MSSPSAEFEARVALKTDKRVEKEYFCWPRWARREQRQPGGDWTTWLLMGGRGSGKTRAGAEWVRRLARRGIGPIALVGETMTEAVDIMVRGESGILSVHDDKERPTLFGRNRLSWPNGVEAMILSGSDPERFRGPQFAAAWCDELGCGAVDNGANQPTIFGDDKSAESGRPYFSSGSPDALMQRQFLRAHHRFWREAANNPPGMVDTDRIYCWTWDARPFPSFPALGDVWTDGPNHRTGHWLTGRLGGLASDELLHAIAGDHGVVVQAVSSAPLIGGMVVGGPGTAREAMEPVLEITGQQLLAREGVLVGMVRGHDATLAPDQLATTDAPVLTRRRSDPAEKPARLGLAHFDRERDHQTATATALRPGVGPLVSQTLPMVLDGAGARLASERLLDNKAAAGDRIELALPPNAIHLEPGDRITLADQAEGPFEISEIRDGAVRRIAATAVVRGDAVATGVESRRSGGGSVLPAVAPIVVAPHLPALPADPLRTRLLLGAYARPWPGTVRIADEITGSTLAQLTRPAAIGTVVSWMAAGPASGWDTISMLEVDLRSGHLADAAEAAVLDGNNRLVVQAETGRWEVIGFVTAELVAPGRYRLSHLLRGCEGSQTAAVLPGARVMVPGSGTISLPVDANWIGGTRTLRAFSGAADAQGELLVVQIDDLAAPQETIEGN